MNRACLVGRITAKPELTYTNSGVAVTKFTVAVNRNHTNAEGKREADFITVRAWRKQAENICKYLDKGSQVSIDGRIMTGSYTDQNGNKRYFTEVVVDNAQFLDSKKTEKSANNLQTDVNDTEDVFADFGEQINIEDDNFLE
jgi:single-strand DNA-binding protein